MTVTIENTLQVNDLLPIVLEGAYSNLFITPEANLTFLDAKTVKFKQMSVGGYKPSTYTSGARKTYTPVDVTMDEQTFELTHFRDFEHNAFIRDIQMSGGVYNQDEIIRTFIETQDIPETDAYFFSKVASLAKAANLVEYTLEAAIDKDTVLDLIDVLVRKGKIKKLVSEGQALLYVSSKVMDSLARTSVLERSINVAQIVEGHAITTRIVRYNNLPIIEVTDADRFYDAFDFSDGFVADGDSLNMVLASPKTAKTVIAFNWLNTLAPGQHAYGASYLTQMEKWMDTFVFANGLNNTVDSIAVSINGTAPTA